jgi:hypothetical protein
MRMCVVVVVDKEECWALNLALFWPTRTIKEM